MVYRQRRLTFLSIKLSLQDSIKARLLDAHPSVIEVIYGEERTAVSLFTQSPELLSSVVTLLTSQQPTRALLRTHLQFFSNAFYNAQPYLGLRVILSLVLPFAIFSKPRQKTAAGVWEVVCGSPLSKRRFSRASSPGDERSSLGADERNRSHALYST